MIFDGHGDILTDIERNAIKGIDVFKNYHYPMYREAGIIGSIFVNYTNPNSPSQDSDFDRINKIALPHIKRISNVHIVRDSNSFVLGKLNVVLGIEGAKPLKSLLDIQAMYNLGYRHLGLVWNERNQFGCGAKSIGGLTPLGAKAITWCNQNGMIVDFAHMNYQTFVDSAKVTTKPILFSHGNVYNIAKHDRNLTDHQLELIKASNGVIGLSVIKSFLTCEKKATIDDLVKHILYIRTKFGIKYVGLGLDFCHYLDDLPQNDVEGLENINTVPILRQKLLRAGLSIDEVDDVLFKNMLRVIKANLK